jgi:hypothetical protein
MTKFAALTIAASTAVIALDAYFAVQVADSLNPHSLNCASSSIIVYRGTGEAATWLAPGPVVALAVFEAYYKRLPTVWRRLTFLPIAGGAALLLVTKYMKLW